MVPIFHDPVLDLQPTGVPDAPIQVPGVGDHHQRPPELPQRGPDYAEGVHDDPHFYEGEREVDLRCAMELRHGLTELGRMGSSSRVRSWNAHPDRSDHRGISHGWVATRPPDR
jgi:hypothetical protein